MLVALIVLAVAALGVYLTIDPGKYRSLAWVLLGFFAFRVVAGRMHQQQQECGETAQGGEARSVKQG